MFEPLQALRIVGKPFGQNLDGDNSMQANIDGAIDLAYPDCARFRLNFGGPSLVPEVKDMRGRN